MVKLSDSEEGIQELTESQVKDEDRPRSGPSLWLFPVQGGDDLLYKGRMKVLTDEGEEWQERCSHD